MIEVEFTIRKGRVSEVIRIQAPTEKDANVVYRQAKEAYEHLDHEVSQPTFTNRHETITIR